MTNGKTEAKGKDTVPLPYGSEAWVAFRTQIYPDFLVALSHGLEEPQKTSAIYHPRRNM